MVTLDGPPGPGGRIDLGQVVTETFGDDRAAVEKYVEELRVSAKDLASSISRSALGLLAFAALFLLLTFAEGMPAPSFALGPINVTDVSVIERALPAVIAYLYYQLVALTYAYSRADWVIFAIMIRYFPDLARSHLDRLLTPQLPRLYHVGGFSAATRWEWVSEAASSLMTIAVSLLPAAFEVYAFYRLFDRFGSDVMVWAVLAITVIALISTLASYVDDARRARYVITPTETGS